MMIYMSKQKELLDSDTTVNSVPMTLPPAYPPGLGTLGTNQLVIAQRSMSPGLFSQTPLQHQAPIGQANPGPVGSTNANHLERLMERLFELFPHHNRETMIGFLKEVRTRNNNSLSGLSFDQIIGHVTVLIKNQEPISSGNSNVDYPIFPVDVPPSGLWRPGNPDPFKMSWQGNPILPLQQSGGSGDMNVLQVKNNAVCEMCHEELTANHLFVLKCGHRYHPECISVWLKEHKTCPSCALGYPASFL
uniref:RING-type domain-containing protein n=1 Tax=Callorhinchus milii TaxID=7868 RepID=A0A4W3HRN1_CALMI